MSSIKKTPRKRPKTNNKEADLKAELHQKSLNMAGQKRINSHISGRNQRRQVARNLRSP